MKTKKRITWLIALSVLASFMMAVSPVQGNATTVGRSDSQTKIFVQYKLIKSGILTDHNVHVTVAHNKIILTGTVPTLFDVSRAQKIVQRVDDHYAIVNDLSVSAPDVPATLMEKEVMHRIETRTFYTVFDWVDVHANGGVVTLNGWVNDPWLRGQYQTQAEKIIGVKKVINHLKMALGSNHLKYRAVRLIYSDPFYWRYSMEINPPIHVIVDGFNLILEGKVSSPGERAFLENLMVFRTNAPRVVDDIQLTNG
jgi:osmotically-inducible protein OsmY